MSRAYICDVCGGYYQKGTQDREARPAIFPSLHDDYKVDSITIYNHLDPVSYKKSYDLCSRCATKLMAFIDAKGGASNGK